MLIIMVRDSSVIQLFCHMIMRLRTYLTYIFYILSSYNVVDGINQPVNVAALAVPCSSPAGRTRSSPWWRAPVGRAAQGPPQRVWTWTERGQ